MLFTREELFQALPTSWQPLRALTVRRYWEVPSEELLEVHRCRLADADAACHFVIESVRNTRHPPRDETWWQTYGKNCLFEPIDAAAIDRRLGEIRGGRWPDALNETGAIGEAVKLFDEWDLWWVIGRAESGWVAIYWQTTA